MLNAHLFHYLIHMKMYHLKLHQKYVSFLDSDLCVSVLFTIGEQLNELIIKTNSIPECIHCDR